MAYVFQTKDKSGKPHRKWRYQFTDWRGRRVTRTGTTSKAETQRLATRQEARAEAVRKGHAPPPTSAVRHRHRSFAEVASEYIAWGCSQGGLHGTSWSEEHARERRRLLKWWENRLGLREIGDMEGILPRMESALRELQGRRLAPKTIGNHAETFAALARWCVDRDYLGDNPLKALGAFDKTPQENWRALTGEEAQALTKHCAPHHRLTWQLALVSGMRRKELLHVQAGDLDVGARALRLRATQTKNKRAALQPLPRTMVLRLAQEAQGKAHDEALLYMPTHTSRDIGRDYRAAGITLETPQGKAVFHSLRSTFATLLDQVGASEKEQQVLTRHRPRSLTFARYTETTPERLRVLVELVGDTVLGGRKNTISAQRKAAGAEGMVIYTGDQETCTKGFVVEDTGLEPVASTMPLSRSPN